MKRFQIILFLITSLMSTTVLFYIDEGNYNFDFFSDWGNRIFFLVFVIMFFSGQGIVDYLLNKKNIENRLLISVILGLPLGLMMYYFLLFILILPTKLF